MNIVKKKKSLRLKIGLGVFGLIILFLVTTAYLVLFKSNTTVTENTYLYVHSSFDYPDFKEALTPFVKSIKTFELATKIVSFKVRPGRFPIRKGMSNFELIRLLRLPGGPPLTITFNNIESLPDLAGKIGASIEADSLSLINQFRDSLFLAENHFTPENALSMYIPNSYNFLWNTSAKNFVNRMLKEYQKFWNDDRRKKLAAMNLSPSEAITLASIVQKESNSLDEYSALAGVYLNRLQQGIPLQADPTVVYAAKKQQNNFNMVIRRVLYKDLAIDSPYNTYKYKGLPPGPIITPNISTIDSVLNYKKHDYIFFIANVNNPGTHIFTKTLKEHENERKKYIRWLNQNKIRR